MPATKRPTVVGLISDTHGTLDPRVACAFEGVDRILHAGDIGRPDVLWELEMIAPVVAVQGNVDSYIEEHRALPAVARVAIGATRVTMAHVRREIPAAAVVDSDVVVFGHSHLPLVEQSDGVLHVNPGSATQPRRSPLGRSVAILDITKGGTVSARIVSLSDFGVCA